MFSQNFQYRRGNRSCKQSNEFQSRHCDLCVLLWVAFLLQVAREFPGHCIHLLHEVLEFSQMLLLRCGGCQNGEHCTETVTYCNHHYPHPSPMGLTLTLLLINNNHPMTWLCTPSTPVIRCGKICSPLTGNCAPSSLSEVNFKHKRGDPTSY